MHKHSRHQMWAAIAVILVGVIILACAGPAAPSGAEPPSGGESDGAGDGAALVQERCTGCHDLARVERASKTRDEWQQNVERMVSNGANLSTSEQAIVVDYLAETYGP